MCGVFGIFGHTEAANLAYLGLHALQHRGQESAGIVSSDGARLYEVRDWPGEIRTPDGSRGDVDGLVAPLRTAPSQGGTWAFPGTSGWLRGFDRVPVTSTGLLAVPPGDGPLWYWPAALITLGNLVTISATAFAAWPLVRARRRAGRSSSPSGA